MMLLMMNSMRARPMPFTGRRHQRKAAAGEAMFIMIRVRVSGRFSRLTSVSRNLQEALIDIPLVALGAGNGDLLAVLQDFRGLTGPDDGGNAQLPADDGGVAGAPPVVRDDAPGPLHDGHPVGVRHFGDQDGVILEPGNIRGALDEADPPGGNGLPDGQAGEQPFALLLSSHRF